MELKITKGKVTFNKSSLGNNKMCVFVEFPNCISKTTNETFKWMPTYIQLEQIRSALEEIEQESWKKQKNIGDENMANIKETANAYEGNRTKNIAELQKVATNMEVEKRTGTNNKGEVFEYNVIIVEGQEYRIPNSVLKDLKEIQTDNENLKEFRVKISGEGMATRYTVIPLS
jgi:23S rRNA maturation-related 3'-5' exoribonuclease YhaM|tara:strand:- start:104 stop:622 length:519 start_codon:yes stop_codon:yes gene_type:complete